MDINSIIGGEFEYQQCGNSPLQSNCGTHTPYTFSSGRSALFHILTYCREQLKCNRVWLPDYLCHSIVDIAVKSQLELGLYHLNDSLQPSIDEMYSIDSQVGGVILIIDYFGIVDNEPIITELKQNTQLVIVKDLVQAPCSILNESSADFQFTSFRKAFAVPDGAWVVTEHPLSQPSRPPKFSEYKIAASLLKGQRQNGYYSDDIYLELFEKGEALIDGDLDADMSAFTKAHFPIDNMSRLSLIRQRNASVILAGLSDLGLKPIVMPASGSTPLFIPITLPNRDNVRKRMFASNIFLPVHWPIETNAEYSKHLVAGRRFAQEELSIIVDQRYGVKDMNRIIEMLEIAIR